MDIDFKTLSVVTSPKLFADKNFKIPHPNGILSEQIFGPLQNYKCACGKYSTKILFNNLRCDTCGVLCAHSSIRHTTFAKIKLNFKVIKKQKISILQEWLKNKKFILDPLQRDLYTSIGIYLKVDIQNDDIIVLDKYDYKDLNILPLTITGIYTLYLGLYCIVNIYNLSKAKTLISCFTDEVLVTPPITRPSIVTDTLGSKQGVKTILTSDLDGAYTNLLITDQRNEYLKEQADVDKYLKMVTTSINLQTGIAISDEELKLFDGANSFYQYTYNQVYDIATSILTGKTGLIRNSFLGKSVDFSSRSVIINDPSLLTYQIKIPKATFIKLYFIEYLRFLQNVKNTDYRILRQLIRNSETNNVHSELNHLDEFIDYFFSEQINRQDRLVIMNRVPSLWKHSLPAVEIVAPLNNNAVISISPPIIESMNADFDGDQMSIFRVHSVEGKQELDDNVFVAHTLQYDHNNDFQHTIMDEAIYGQHLLASVRIDYTKSVLEIDSLQDLPFNYELYHNQLSTPVKFKDSIYSYGQCLLNKVVGLSDEIKINCNTSAKEISRVIHSLCSDDFDYHYRLCKTNKILNWLVATHPTKSLTLPVNESLAILDQYEEDRILNNLPKNPYIGTHLYNAKVKSVFDGIDVENNLSHLLRAKNKRIQIARSIISIGFIADEKNIINSNAINSNLLGGLDQDDFFISCMGSRKALVDKQLLTPASGYLERSLTMALSVVELDMEDCGTNHGFIIDIESKNHAKSLIGRWFKENSSMDWKLFSTEHVNQFVNKSLMFRSPIACANPNYKICKKCFGHYPNLKTPYVGIITGQVISERTTQLTLRTFHISGSITLDTNQELIKYIQNHVIDIQLQQDESIIIFDEEIPNNIKIILQSLKGHKITLGNKTSFENIFDVENEDIGKVINDLRKCLLTEIGTIGSIHKTYSKLISSILSIGDIYSVFIEIVLCNLYINSKNKIIRYQIKDNEPISVTKKYSIFHIHGLLSPTLNLLYKPNLQTINDYYNTNSKLENVKPSIFERIWLDI